MSDFTAALYDNPHPKPTPKPPQPTLIDCLTEAVIDAFGLVRKTRQLTKSDCKLVA